MNHLDQLAPAQETSEEEGGPGTCVSSQDTSGLGVGITSHRASFSLGGDYYKRRREVRFYRLQ